MNERCKRQQEFKEIFEKTHGAIPYKQIFPIKYNDMLFIPTIEKHKEYYTIHYTSKDYDYRYDVLIGKEEYDQTTSSK